MSGFSALEQQLEQFVETVRQIGIIVSDFQPNSQSVLNSKICQMTEEMRSIEQSKKQVEDVNVPLEVLDHIDQGKNPQLYTQQCLQKLHEKGMQVQQKVDAYKTFQKHLFAELEQFFPEQMQQYHLARQHIK
ncbi:mediator of RNA polymerase II transcription subunit 10-like [Corticium candelabrum]|uniref:mediator of RNA polymerase II transcription subunit 10-like n=1 Tax=Corticium candelabrum TaxID=121492 RepID=UPI002E26B3D6|nr:mediator of RNA polymerase II transcription subunit 10-like [Corticium candelabrum]